MTQNKFRNNSRLHSGLPEQWQRVDPRATVEKMGQPVDPARLCFLFLSSPAVRKSITYKEENTTMVVDFKLFSLFSDLFSGPLFLVMVCCSSLLPVTDLAAKEGVLEAGGRSCGRGRAW